MEIAELLELLFETWWDKYQGIENEEEAYFFFLDYFIHSYQLAGDKEEILDGESLKKLIILLKSEDKDNNKLGIEVLRSFQLKKEILIDYLWDVFKENYTRFFEFFIEILRIIDMEYFLEMACVKMEKEKVNLLELLSIATEEEIKILNNELELLENELSQTKEELMSPTDRVYMQLKNLVVEILEHLMINEADNEDLVRKIVSDTLDKYEKKTRIHP